MKIKYVIVIMLFLAISTLTACGGGDDNGVASDPNAPASVTLVPSKTVALANGSDAITLRASVQKADGSAVADGTVVSFSAPGSAGNLSAPSATCAGGLASVTLTHPAISVNNVSVVVTAVAGDKSGNMSVKFINQPTSVDVSVGFGIAVTNLAALQFQLNSTAGATFDNTAQLISRINNAAAGSSSILAAGFSPATNSLTVALANTSGFNTGTTPIIKATYAIAAGSGLPTFSVAATGFTATDPLGNATVPQVAASNMFVSTVFNTEL